MKVQFVVFSVMLFWYCGFSQKRCTSNPTTISSNTNFGSIVWDPTGGATVAECNNMADGIASFTGNVVVDVANNRTTTISNNVTIIGNFPISGGPGSALTVSGNSTLHVTGNLGSAASNGVIYNVPATLDHIIVDGTLFGKNDNAFNGNGSISGGTLDVKNGSTCGTPCPVAGGFTNCNSGDSFCTTFGVLPVVLTNFDFEMTPHSIIFNWSTATEINFDYFTLQRSLDGMTYTSIAKIAGL